MLSIKLSTLDEIITYYRDVLIPGLEEQGVSLGNMIEELSSSWSGVHADTYRESLYGLIYGNGEADSLALVIQKAKNILKALEAGEEVFLTEMSRCDEFPVMLTDVSVNPFMNPAPKVPMDEYLLCNYEAVESLCTKISDLMETDCAYPEGGANSQIGRWNDLVSVFESGLRESSYSPGYSNVLVQHALEQEYTKLRNFDYGLRTYHCNLGQIEENLMEAFGAETSEYAKTLTREIYEVFDDDKRNNMRILYLSQKSPDTYTPEEMDEIHRILAYTTNPPQGQQQPDQAYLGRHMVADQMFQNALENTALNQLFRGYSAALQTKYATEIPRMGDLDRLSDYFYKDTLQRLANADGTTNFDQLNGLMKLNPDSMTLGDCKALSEVFDQLMADTERESVDAANQFLANCYINGVENPEWRQDADRSLVFDRWSTYYVKTISTVDDDYAKIESSSKQERMDVRTKFMKQALHQMVSSNAARELQINGGFHPEDPNLWLERQGVFEVNGLTERAGDYQFTMYQNYNESGQAIVIEYYEYRDSSSMPNILDEDVKGKVKSYKKEFPEYVEETVKGYIADTLTTVLPAEGAKAVLDSGGGTAIDVALEAAKFGAGWDKQKKENAEIDAVLRKDYEGEEMEAYQRSGQLLYVNGVRVVNNESTDKSRLDELTVRFKEQIDVRNDYYREFFPKGCDQATRDAIEAGLHNPKSVEYKNAFIKWYTEGIGDLLHDTGRKYQLEEEKK